MQNVTDVDRWLPWREAYSLFRREFRTPYALEYHLRHRKRNGLTAADAVRKSPLGHLIINTPRFRLWLDGDSATENAASP